MYLDHFGLLENPFSIAPDPRYLYMSDRHREALAHLLYGMASDGAFILLTGEVGTGKTTVSRCLLEQVPEDTNLALVLNPKLSAIELLQVICDELRIEYSTTEMSVKLLVDVINRYLLAAHSLKRKTVVLIEEAQNLDLDVLEQLRLLTNLETNERKLLQVILLGQPEFLEVLDRPELSQLAQRITARFHLKPLKLKEVEQYIAHRLAVAGCRRPLFAHGVIKQLFNYSGGVPRLINVICDRALLGCYVQNKQQIDKATLGNAAKEVLGEKKSKKIKSNNKRNVVKLFGLIVLALLVAVVMSFADDLSARFAKLNVANNVAPLESNLSSNKKLSVKNNDGVRDAAINGTGISAKAEVVAAKHSAQVLLADELKPVTSNSSGEAEPLIEAFQWPNNNQRLRSNLQAFQALFNVWKMDYQFESDGTPCFYGQTKNLSCFHGRSNLAALRKLNRPAVLTLYDDTNQPQYVTLLSIDHKWARIYLAEKEQAISLQQLAFYWRGEFTLLWKFPSGYSGLIRPGSSGITVVWLSKIMNRIDNKEAGYGRSYYDEEMVQQVKKFQLRQGLNDDGVVGVKTLIHINQQVDKNAPLLEVL